MKKRNSTALPSILRIILGVLFVTFCLFASFFGLALYSLETGDVDGPAPKGSYEDRRSWGEDNLGVFFASAEAFVKRNKTIKNDIGEIYGVAPILSPNKHGSSFGESCTKLNLQVIGSRGEGVLRLSEYNWGGRLGQPKWEQEHWLYRQF
ncbi:hypothetical protein OAG71_00395 [bacterium]|nr:hypothetical protein [bacterium]